MYRRFLRIPLLTVLFSLPCWAQTSPTLYQGETWTPQQWMTFMASKQDYYQNVSASAVLIGPQGSSGTPTWRNITLADVTGLSSAWSDYSYTATSTASVPTGLGATSSRIGIDIENLNPLGGATACMNWSSVATVNGANCGLGSIPIQAGGARLWDQPANVSPEAISIICAGSSCPLTIKVR